MRLENVSSRAALLSVPRLRLRVLPTCLACVAFVVGAPARPTRAAFTVGASAPFPACLNSICASTTHNTGLVFTTQPTRSPQCVHCRSPPAVVVARVAVNALALPPHAAHLPAACCLCCWCPGSASACTPLRSTPLQHTTLDPYSPHCPVASCSVPPLPRFASTHSSQSALCTAASSK